MSLYDKFRAPQYVDFGKVDQDTTDNSSFFDHDMDSSSSSTITVKKADSSSMSFSADETLTPSNDEMCDELDGSYTSYATGFNRSKSSQAVTNDDEMTPDMQTVAATPGFNSSFSSPVLLNSSTPMPSTDINPSKGVLKKGTPYFGGYRTQTNGGSSVPVSARKSIKKTRFEVRVIPPTPDTTIQSDVCGTLEPHGSKPKQSSTAGCSKKVSYTTRRRSQSASTADRYDDATCLEYALRSLQLCGKKSIHEDGGASALDCQVVNGRPSIFSNDNHQMQSTSKAGSTQIRGRKRNLSPHHSVQNPEKFISLSEYVAKHQKRTPPRFRSMPKSTMSKNAEKSKVARRVFSKNLTKNDVNANTLLGDGHQQEGSSEGAGLNRTPACNEKGVKVPRLPHLIEPFKPTEYKKKPCAPKYMLDCTKRQKVLVANRRTPIKAVRKPTEPKPFSFYERDQEFIRRKLARIRGEVDSQGHCYTTTRRRSKSEGEKNEDTGKKVEQARFPSVLNKPPFKPQKSQQKPTVPLDIHLNTEKRALERHEYDLELYNKEREREKLRQKLREEKQLQEAKDVQRLRKELVYKAKPAPPVKHFRVKPSDKPLTTPASPCFWSKKAPLQENHSSKDSMES